MADDTTAAPAEGIFTPSLPADTGPINAIDAGRLISEARAKQAQPEAKTDQPRVNGRFASAAAETQSPSQEDDAARPQDATGETQEADPAEQPPLELPRSWSKDKAEVWNSLSRDAQEHLLDHDKTSSAEVRRVQNEAAEIRKAAEAERTAATQARTQYEQAAQNSLQILQADQAREFGDIKTMADIQKLSVEDPFRYSQWDARQKMIEWQAREVQTLNQQREQEQADQFKTWAKEQDDKFSKRFPEFNDPEKGPKVRASVQSYLTKEIGVPEDVLPKLWSNPLFRDEMFQRVIYEASRFHKAQQDAKSAVPVNKPAPQRPGTAPQKGAQLQDEIAAAQQRLSGTKGIEAARIAADLMAMKRRAATRR